MTILPPIDNFVRKSKAPNGLAHLLAVGRDLLSITRQPSSVDNAILAAESSQSVAAVVGLPFRVLDAGNRLVQNLYFAVDTVAQFAFCNFKVITDLQPKPNCRTRAKIARQSHRGIHSNRALTVDNLANANRSNANILCQSILA